MNINLMTDAKRHNLALMRISAHHKALGDMVTLNLPLQPCDVSYGSWLWQQKVETTFAGGPAVDPAIRLNGFEKCKPDYDLFPIDYSLGYTWEYCPRNCGFCIVPKQNNPKVHHSIWEFHDSRFKKICLLNNNTFSDPQWKETFEEIWDAGLILKEHGFDARLLTEEKAEALKRTKFEGAIHFAWDNVNDEKAVLRGLRLVQQFRLDAMVYVLIGYDSTPEEDLYRCQKIHDLKFDPYVMPYATSGHKASKQARAFKRFIDCRYYRRYPTIEAAWRTYRR